MEAPALGRAAVIALSQSEEFLIRHVSPDSAQRQNHAQGSAGPAQRHRAGITAEVAPSGGQARLNVLQETVQLMETQQWLVWAQRWLS